METEHFKELIEQLKKLNGYLEAISKKMDEMADVLGEIRDKLYGGGIL